MRLKAVALIVTLAFGVLAAPHAIDAQPPAKLHRVGYLAVGSPPVAEHLVEAFRQGLRELGYVEGKESAFAAMPRGRAGVLLVVGDPMFF